MRVQFVVNTIGRKNGIQLIFNVKHQRIVFKTVRMIVHIFPVEQETTVFCSRNIIIPFSSCFAIELLNVKHLCIEESRYSRKYNHFHRKSLMQAPHKQHPKRSHLMFSRS